MGPVPEGKDIGVTTGGLFKAAKTVGSGHYKMDRRRGQGQGGRKGRPLLGACVKGP